MLYFNSYALATLCTKRSTHGTDPRKTPGRVFPGGGSRGRPRIERVAGQVRVARTRKTYFAAIAHFVAFSGIASEADWRSIGPAHAIAWTEAIRREAASDRTIHTRLSAPSSLFKHLCEKQAVADNPVRNIKRPRVNTGRVKTPAITRNQAMRMLDAPDTGTLKGLRDRAILETFFRTGSRIAEVCRLKVKDFLQDGGYMVLELKVKGNKDHRLAIHQELQIAITMYLEASGHGGEKEAPLFLSVRHPEERRHLNPSQVNRIFGRYARKEGLPENVTPHTARTTFATEGLKAGASLEEMEAALGRANIQTTKMYDQRRFGYRESVSFRVNY